MALHHEGSASSGVDFQLSIGQRDVSQYVEVETGLMIVCSYEQRQRILTDQRHWSIACDRLLLPLKLNPEPVAMVQNGS